VRGLTALRAVSLPPRQPALFRGIRGESRLDGLGYTFVIDLVVLLTASVVILVVHEYRILILKHKRHAPIPIDLDRPIDPQAFP